MTGAPAATSNPFYGRAEPADGLPATLFGLPSAATPDALTREAVAALEARAGAPLLAIDPEALRAIYGLYVEWVVPVGEAPLAGDEPERLRRFKDALGLDDETAGPVHVEVGRRVLRGRLEAGTRSEDAAARRTFQKLIYVSYLLFGDRAYVTPWARAFRLTDAQIYVARRDCARALFQKALDGACEALEVEEGAPPAAALRLDDGALGALAAARDRLRLPAEEAADMARFARAAAALRQRSRRRDLAAAAAELDAALAFNAALAEAARARRAARAGPRDGRRRRLGRARGYDREARELYRAYVEHALDAVAARVSAGEEGACWDAGELRAALGLGPREAQAEEAAVKEQVYRRLLRAAAPQLDAAASPAALLGALVERLCGAQFREALERALARADAGGLEPEALRAVRAAARDLLLDPPAARAALAELARRRLLAFVGAARRAKDKPEAAKELANLVEFNAHVVSPLLDELRTREEREAAREAAIADSAVYDLVMELRGGEDDADDDEPLEVDEQGQPRVRVPSRRLVQTEINLAQDVDRRDRLALYRDEVTRCTEGEMQEGPMGAQIAVARGAAEYERLAELAGVLGLSAADVQGVHTELAEATFKARAAQVLGADEHGADRLEQLDGVRRDLRLSEEAAQRVIRGFQNRAMAQGLHAARAQGRLTLASLLDLHSAGVDVAGLTTREARQQIFRDGVLERLGDGKGVYDRDELVNRVPAALGLDPRRAARAVREIALERRRTTLVQAVSCLRQRREAECVAALNNFAAVEAAAEAEHPLDWSPREELADLYALYASRVDDDDRRLAVQRALALSDGDAEGLRELIAAGEYKIGLESDADASTLF
ncbi:hypothetical protein QBZ16_002164 [Prototheca wickerhamii]|uniref:Uncharacterized protein n=1 Tax=Prototheca wickerhamii TaxID=3111 RepID=A0AAD9MI86_PROWI|nr:hypothetical protein QBZ16_002164 [Prototheca wickerhamii]